MEFKKRSIAIARLIALAAYRAAIIKVGVHVSDEIKNHQNMGPV